MTEQNLGKVQLHCVLSGEDAYKKFKEIASEFYANHTYRFASLTLDSTPNQNNVAFTAEFWRPANKQLSNNRLTIADLRNMDGEAVWVIVDTQLSFYALVEVCEDGIFLTNNLGARSGYSSDQELEYEGIVVCRYKPKDGVSV